MKAYIDHSFAKGFLLSEEHIIKIDDIIRKRLAEHGFLEPLEFRVYRADGLVYSTEDHKTVLAEENSIRNAIMRLSISHENERVKFNLDFHRAEGTKFKVEAEDKDFAYLLFSDVKDYLTPEVLKFRSFRFKDTRIDRWVFPVMMLFIMGTMLRAAAYSGLDDLAFGKLINQGSVEDKLNYLLETGRIRKDLRGIWYWGIVVIALAFLSEVFLSSMDRFFPINVFCTGKELAKYQKLVDTRGKILWGVLISLAVSLVAGVILAYMRIG